MTSVGNKDVLAEMSRPGLWLFRVALASVLGLLILPQSALAADCGDWNDVKYFHTVSLGTLKECLRHGADANARNEAGQAPLQSLLKANRKHVTGEDRTTFARVAVMELLAAGADPNVPSGFWPSPLRISIEYEDPAITRALLEAGANPNAGPVADRPLFQAIKTDRKDLVSALLAFGADVRAFDENGQTSLHGAAIASTLREGVDDTMTQMLLEAGADPNARDANGETPLFQALSAKAHRDVLTALLDAGADPNAENDFGDTPLEEAAIWASDPAIIAALVAAGADHSHVGMSGMTSLHWAAYLSEEPDIVAALLDAGANPLVFDAGGWSPLAAAIVYNGNPDVVSVLLDAHQVATTANAGGERRGFRQPGLHKVHCWFELPSVEESVACFYMVVHEDPNDDLSRLISFPVVKISSPDGRSSGKNPVLDLGGGGPGLSAGLETDILRPLLDYRNLARLAGRDFYAIDPRGVGMAHPRLTCVDFFEPVRSILSRVPAEREEWEAWQAIYRKCKGRILDLGYDLSHYRSRIVAHDVELLRRALKEEKWALVGHSYAARYALTVARDFPQRVEALTLFSAAFPNAPSGDGSLEMYFKAFERAFAWCGNAGTCDPALLQERFQRLVDGLNEVPLVVHDIPEEIVDIYGDDYQLERFVLTGDRLVELVFLTFYDSNFFATLPGLVEELERGESGILMYTLPVYLSYYLGADYSDPVGMSHYCAETFPFLDYSALLRSVKQAPPYIGGLYDSYTENDFRDECWIWNVHATEPSDVEPIVTSIPTLFLQGALDPATPIEHLIEQLPNFGNHTVLMFENSSHWGDVAGECAMRAAAFFLEHRYVDSEHANCADSWVEASFE